MLNRRSAVMSFVVFLLVSFIYGCAYAGDHILLDLIDNDIMSIQNDEIAAKAVSNIGFIRTVKDPTRNDNRYTDGEFTAEIYYYGNAKPTATFNAELWCPKNASGLSIGWTRDGGMPTKFADYPIYDSDHRSAEGTISNIPTDGNSIYTLGVYNTGSSTWVDGRSKGKLNIIPVKVSTSVADTNIIVKAGLDGPQEVAVPLTLNAGRCTEAEFDNVTFEMPDGNGANVDVDGMIILPEKDLPIMVIPGQEGFRKGTTRIVVKGTIVVVDPDYALAKVAGASDPDHPVVIAEFNVTGK